MRNYISKAVAVAVPGSSPPMNHALTKAFPSDTAKPEVERLLNFEKYILTYTLNVLANALALEMSK